MHLDLDLCPINLLNRFIMILIKTDNEITHTTNPMMNIKLISFNIVVSPF
jgi:hypothetical protein